MPTAREPTGERRCFGPIGKRENRCPRSKYRPSETHLPNGLTPHPRDQFAGQDTSQTPAVRGKPCQQDQLEEEIHGKQCSEELLPRRLLHSATNSSFRLWPPRR